MNTYEQAVFDFFSQRDKLENMLKIRGHYNLVRKELLKHFWNEVKKETHLLLLDNPEWEIEYTSNDISIDNTRLAIYKKTYLHQNPYPLSCVAFERMGAYNFPYLGLWLNYSVLKEKTSIIKQTQYIIDSDLEIDKNDWWLGWKRISGLDFRNDDDLLKITPKEGVDLAKSLARDAVDLLIKAEPLLDKISEEYSI